MHRFSLVALLAIALAPTLSGQTTTLRDKNVKVIGDGVAESCWKISNPSGPSDYFNNDYDLSCAGDQIQAIAAMFCETDTGGAMSEIGFYYDNLGVDASGATPDLSNVATRLLNPTGLPGTFCTTLVGYDVPDATISTTLGGHAVVGMGPGDSAAWLCADTTPASQAGKSYFTTDGFNTPAVPFTVNWMLFPAARHRPGTFTVNGGDSATITEGLDSVTFTLYGNPAVSGEAWMLYLSDGLGNPVILAPPFVFFTSNGRGALRSIWPCWLLAYCGRYPYSLTWVALWQDTVDTKPNGKGKLKLTNEIRVEVLGYLESGAGHCDPPCPGTWGQQDDGILDSTIWRVLNPAGVPGGPQPAPPAGPGDWFNVHHGTNAGNPDGVSTLTGIEVASWDFCGTGPARDEVGLYPADLTLDPTGGTPAIGSPISRITGTAASVGASQSDWSYPSTFYDLPDVAHNTTTDYHAAVKWATGDTCVWIGSDTDGSDSGGSWIPSTESYFTSDGYATPAVQQTTANWMIKIDWQ